MTANDAGVGTHRFREGILGAFDGIFHLRAGDAPFFPGFHLKGNGPHPGKQHHAEAVDQLLLLSLLLPGVAIALGAYHQEMIPLPLLRTIIESKKQWSFPLREKAPDRAPPGTAVPPDAPPEGKSPR